MGTDDQMAEVSYNLRRLVEMFEVEVERRERFERDLVTIINRSEIADAQQLLLLNQILDKPPLTREDVLAALRMAADEIRQGLGLRAMGATPWPKDVPPSDPAPQKEPTVKFEVDKQGTAMITLPKLTWKSSLSALKWTVAIASAGTSVVLVIRAIWKALLGAVD